MTDQDLLDPATVDALRAEPRAVDHRALAMRGVRRRRRRSAATGVGALVAVAVLAFGGAALQGDRDPRVDVVDAPPARVEPVVSTDVGLEWREVPPSPLSPRVEPRLRDVGDGRVLVVGGEDAIPGEGQRLHDAAVLDTATMTWSVIDDLPDDAGLASFVEFADNRLVLAYQVDGGGGAGLRGGGVVVDLTTDERWEVPADPSLPGFVEAMAFDGRTVVAMRFEEGTFDDDQVNEPQVWRWDVGDEAWSRGAAPPLPSTYEPAVAVDGGRVVVWGGAIDTVDLPAEEGSTQRSPGEEHFVESDDASNPGFGDALPGGAVYDISDDTWSRLPDAAYGLGPASGQVRDGLLTVAGARRDVEDGSLVAVQPAHAVLQLDLDAAPADGSEPWRELVASDDRVLDLDEGWLGRSERPVVTSLDPVGSEADGTAQLLVEDRRLPALDGERFVAPYDVGHHRVGDRVVAAGHDSVREDRYRVAVLDDDTWQDLSDVPTLGRARAVTIADVGVLFGPAAPGWEPSNTWWLLAPG